MILASLKKSLLPRIASAAEQVGAQPPEKIEFQPAPAHVPADLCLPWPLSAAKQARKPPMEVAAAVCAALQSLPEIEEAKAAPPGFVNLRLRLSALAANVKAATLNPAAYGRDEGGGSRKILIEFVSANPTGPLHLASGRGATLGDALARILRRLGRQVHCEYYVNDAGGRVELLGRSIQARWDQNHGKNTEVPEKGYQGEYLKELAASAPAEAGGWTAEQWGRFAMDALLASHKEDMDAFGVKFDRWYLESELYASKLVEQTLAFLKERGMVYEKESAVWLGTAEAEGSTDDKDRVLVKSDGRPTYFLPDIAYHRDKFGRGFEELIDIWGADHHGYVPRMRAAIAALGKPPESFKPIVHQLIHLFRGKEAVKMSKRAGEFVRLKEVVDEVGRDACRFFFALRTPDSHLAFDLELAKKQSAENPVFYCQYVHARVCSIFREAAKRGSPYEDGIVNGALLSKPEERAILVKLAWFPEALRACERELSPHPLANYLLETAGLFHPFYEKCRVVDPEEPALTQARLLLCAGVRDIIREGLGLLGVCAPEEM